jgi:hypothetical protein
MRIDSSGNVAIGATSSTSKLRVIGNEIRFSNSSNASFYGTITHDAASTGANIYNNNDGTAVSHIWQHNGTEKMRIDSSGRLLVGTSTEGSSSADDLTVATSAETGITIRSGTGSNGNIFFSDGTSGDSEYKGYISYEHSNDALAIGTSNVERIKIASAGNVIFSNSNYVSFNNNGYIRTDSSGYLRLQMGSNGTMFTNFSNTEVARIDSSGRLGIGTSSPSRTLHVRGVSTAAQFSGTGGTGYICIEDADDGTIGFIGIDGGKLKFQTPGNNHSDKLIITPAGNVGIGEPNPDYPLCVSGTGAVRAKVTCTNNNSSGAGLFLKTLNGGSTVSSGTIAINNSGSLIFFSGGSSESERMRIDPSGRLLINRTSAYSSEMLSVKYPPGNRGMVIDTSTTFSGNSNIIEFRANGTLGGSITFTNNGTSTAYVVSSDYRLKENVVDLTAAIPRLKALPVHRFNFITNSELTVDGFLAHEAQLVVPEAVTGTHNEVDGDGNPIMQGIDQAKLVPLLTAALKEAIGRIETLETEVAALKAE